MTEPVFAAPAAVFADKGRARFRTVALEWPVSVGGVEYSAIGLKRLTAGEVAAFSEKVRGLPEGTTFVWPIFVGADGAPLPEGVMDALDDDDRMALDEAALDFLPRRFRGDASAASAPADGANTA